MTPERLDSDYIGSARRQASAQRTQLAGDSGKPLTRRGDSSRGPGVDATINCRASSGELVVLAPDGRRS